VHFNVIKMHGTTIKKDRNISEVNVLNTKLYIEIYAHFVRYILYKASCLLKLILPNINLIHSVRFSTSSTEAVSPN